MQTATATATPSSSPRAARRDQATTRMRKKPAAKVAANAASVVARPECARKTGRLPSAITARAPSAGGAISARPDPDQDETENHERQNAGSRQDQKFDIGMAEFCIKKPSPLDPHVAAVLRAVAGEIGTEGDRDARQRRVQRLVGVLILIEQLHARRDMRRFVECDREDVIGRNDAARRDNNRKKRHPPQETGERYRPGGSRHLAGATTPIASVIRFRFSPHLRIPHNGARRPNLP